MILNVIDYIPVGHKNAVTRQYLTTMTGLSDRTVREMIEKECTSEHPILNMQDGKGYFQPAADEMHLVRLYLAQENHRTVRIRKKLSEIKKCARSQNEVEKNQISIFDCMGGGSDG